MHSQYSHSIKSRNYKLEDVDILKCRVCLKIGCIPLFGEDNVGKDLMDICAIDVREFDNLPKHLCDTCYKLLQAAMVFRKMARKSDSMLNNFKINEDAPNFKVADENDYVVVPSYLATQETFIKQEYLEVNDTEDSSSESDCDTIASKYYDDDSSVEEGDEDKAYLVIKESEAEQTVVDGSSDNSDTEVTEQPPDLTCHTCLQIFNSPQELYKHLKIGHMKTCEICKEIVSFHYYKVHMKLHRETHKRKTKKNCIKVECEICHKVVNKNYYKYHKKMHGDASERAERRRECPFCNKSISATNLADHIRRLHTKEGKNNVKETKYLTRKQCPVCDRYIKEDKYEEHLANHSKPSKEYFCDKCEKKCATSSSFKTHRLTHGSELKYKCAFCSYRGLHLGLLQIHVRTHTKDYNYKCTLCPAKFITKSNLSIHMQRHTGVGKFKCDQCDKTFHVKRNMMNHFKARHLKERNHKCDMCGAMFAHHDGLLSHQIKQHKRPKLYDHKGRLPTYLKKSSNDSE